MSLAACRMVSPPDVRSVPTRLMLLPACSDRLPPALKPLVAEDVEVPPPTPKEVVFSMPTAASGVPNWPAVVPAVA